MRFSLTFLVKLTGLLGMFATMVAIGVARLEPRPAHFRMKSPPAYSLINGFVLNADGSDLKFLNASTGQLQSLKLPVGQRLDHASCSPWVDDRGEYEVVGRWAQHTLGADPYRIKEFGIARYAMPSGRLISKSEMEIVPASHPCWFPGNVAKVLFSGSDGRLYQVDFKDQDLERDEQGDVEDSDASSSKIEPRLIRWACEPPGSRIMVTDPVWNPDSKLGRRLIVSMAYWTGEQQTQLTNSQLWWLELNADGTEIVAAAPLDPTDLPASQSRTNGEERHPSLTVTPSGEVVLAYLWQPDQTYGRWELRLANIDFDPTTQLPLFHSKTSKIIAVSHLGELPRFSTDGQWLYAILRNQEGQGGKIVRFSSDPKAVEVQHTLASLPKS